MKYNRIVLLAGQWDTTPIVYNFLQKELSVYKVVLEEPVDRKKFLQNRVKKLGWVSVGGQVLFQLLVGKPLKMLSSKRIDAIISKYGLSRDPIPAADIFHVPSVNAAQCLEVLKQLQPDLVIVHGTRIISKNILRGAGCTFINIHAGITPRYRGSHGAYWALANNDPEHCGVTVHLIDEGIDTGNILKQVPIKVTPGDNFATYSYIQLAEGLLALKEAVRDLEHGKQEFVGNTLDSALWHHPTLWGYLYKRLFKGVR